MSAYTTVEVRRSKAIAFLMSQLYIASNEELGDMMDVYGDTEPYTLNNFDVIDD